jgi:hypothetical protein
MKVKTSELTGAALDWAVARCEGGVGKNQLLGAWYAPSTDWAQGGPIIEREGLLVGPSPFPAQADSKFAAGLGCDWDTCTHIVTGPTPLIAAMRCYVASKLGDTVDIPEELK